MFGWYQQWRRKRLLVTPLDPAWMDMIQSRCKPFGSLSSEQQTRLVNDVRIFIAEKHWEGCNGLVVTDEMRVTIAVQACLMALGFPGVPFERLLSVLIYPDTFVAKATRQQPWGVVQENDEPRLGEAWYQGPVVLSWKEVLEQTTGVQPARNVVIHEFSHLLDMQNREVDGIPDLDHTHSANWVPIFEEAYERLVRQARLGRVSVLDDYGATSKIEFFAVSSEAFFEQPQRLRDEFPSLYGILNEYYRQDPAAWILR
ncbi:MAG TPA: M90 family metallopeptidase [Planctomycetaceae bacterium]|nr:M90 family metallopeptidase [Planctomycetaceae bacterium]